MPEQLAVDGLEGRLHDMVQARIRVGGELFAAESERIARLCHAMAERFARGGRLVAFASAPAARSDARHVAVEFVHPVIVGKRALPALALTDRGADLLAQLELLLREQDIAIGFGVGQDDGEAAAGIAEARRRGCLTIGFADADAEWRFEPASEDPHICQEVVETVYHVLWELVHVFFEHRGLLASRIARPTHDAGASSFLYPFLAEQERELEPVLADVASSARTKSREIGELREQTLIDNHLALAGAAGALRASFTRGGKLLALGNGGSATDAMDLVADFRTPGGGARGWPALDLTEDSAILTALANDIGSDAIFSRQVIAHGDPGDVLVALSTSGGSRNVIEALAQARKRDLGTIALVGYDGGRIASDGLADFVVVTRSEHIPRIQEAQATAYHALVELVELTA